MKTAVEQLRIELMFSSKQKHTESGKVSFTIGLSVFDELFRLAKEIEKQQIIEAHVGGFYSPPFGKSRNGEAEQYYNETFKSE